MCVFLVQKGQLGLGDFNQRNMPVIVKGLDNEKVVGGDLVWYGGDDIVCVASSCVTGCPRQHNSCVS